MRKTLAALLAFSFPASAWAQVRAVAPTAPAAAASAAAAAPSALNLPAATVLSLSVPLAPLSAPTVFSAPLPRAAALTRAGLPAASAPVPVVPAVSPAAPGAASDAPAPAPAPDADAPESGSGRAPTVDSDGKLVVYSLQDLDLLLNPDGSPIADPSVFDGAPRRRAPSTPGKPVPVPGMRGVAVRQVPAEPSVELLPEFAQHEIDTIKKIQRRAQDLQVLVRENAATPDLLVRGVAIELKTVHRGKFERQLDHANGQLVSHAKRHSLGLGDVVLDVIGQPVPPEQVEADIAAVVARAPAVGFDRVYVFHGDELRVYARDASGVFRYDPAAEPFVRRSPRPRP